jgi:hypothetical protein
LANAIARRGRTRTKERSCGPRQPDARDWAQAEVGRCRSWRSPSRETTSARSLLGCRCRASNGIVVHMHSVGKPCGRIRPRPSVAKGARRLPGTSSAASDSSKRECVRGRASTSAGRGAALPNVWPCVKPPSTRRDLMSDQIPRGSCLPAQSTEPLWLGRVSCAFVTGEHRR